jgi:PPOX class probable F420-dependent enzyme
VSTPLPDDVRLVLDHPNPAVMATLAKDGRPVTAATWYQLAADGRILVNLDAERVRLRHLRRDPRFSLTVLDGDDWYKHVSVQLVAADISDDVGLTGIDSLAQRYLGTPYPNRERPRVNIRADIVAWQRWANTGD